MADSSFPLSIIAGDSARQRLASVGWNPAIFTTMVGASGGAKLLGLGHLDTFLFTDYLQRSDHPMALYGSSIGSWRHAALASADPASALANLHHRYLNQTWADDDKRGATVIVDELCEWVMDGLLPDENAAALCSNPRFSTHIVTARGRGPNGVRSKPVAAIGMGLTGAANAFYRGALGIGFQRVVFSAGTQHGFNFRDFSTTHVTLTKNNLRDALLASGSIPLLMSGRSNIEGAPPGHYWDGGILDYHFDFANAHQNELILYPHFSSNVVKGWFDKPWPWRRNSSALLDNVVIVAPSPSYVTALPHGKIPDRGDFSRMKQADRIQYWQTTLDESQRLADAMREVVEDPDPLRFLAPPPGG